MIGIPDSLSVEEEEDSDEEMEQIQRMRNFTCNWQHIWKNEVMDKWERLHDRGGRGAEESSGGLE